MRVLITGANGFLGKNLLIRLNERKDIQVHVFTRESDASHLSELLNDSDFIFHFAGANRPIDDRDLIRDNADLTYRICSEMARINRKTPILYTSSTQADLDNPYGLSKKSAEEALFKLNSLHKIPIHIFRLPNVFGKWSRPKYNSVVATFCYNIGRDLPIEINDPASDLKLAYVDDVIERFMQIMDGADSMLDEKGFEVVVPQFSTTVGELANQIQCFKNSRQTLVTERTGHGLVRALYSTYLSFLPLESFAYELVQHGDSRGIFVEMLKTPDCGQISFFTAYPGVTRGGHYHHAKSEKFLVVQGQACFRFRNLDTGDTCEIKTAENNPQIVETIPGWTHDITNVGNNMMIVMLWASEVFDRTRPDTYSCPM